MKSSPDSFPRMLCRVIRLWARLRGERPRSHLPDCADCRDHFAAVEAWEDHLRREARTRVPEVPFGLERSIMDSIAPALRARSARPARGGNWLWMGAGLAACAALAVAWVWVRPPDPAPLVAQEEAPAIVTTPEVALTWTALGVRLRESVAPATSTLTGPDPLQNEIDRVYADTRSALAFLARNFLAEVPEVLEPDAAAAITSS